AALFGIGAGLVAIGYTGTLFGNLIKSAVSRQREYLADASAVQFTRSHQGIAGALKKIGQHQQGSNLRAANASEFSHMYFASGLKNSLFGLFATHPPLAARIGRLDPQWKGWGSAATPAAAPSHSDQVSAIYSAEAYPPSPSADHGHYRSRLDEVLEAVDNNIAQPSATQLAMGGELLARIPADLKAAAHDPFAARAVVYALMMCPAQFELQRALLEKSAHPAVRREFDRLQPVVAKLPVICRLPLLDLCVPALKALAPQQYQIFKRNLIKLLRADGKVEIWEWALYRVLMHGLEANPDRQRKGPAGGSSGSAQADAQRFLLAAMAHAGNNNYLNAKRAYEAGLATLGQIPVPLPAARDINLQRLDKALAISRDTAPLKKPALLKALATTLAHDGLVCGTEIELLRAVADCLDCPMPPLQGVSQSPLRQDERAIASTLT
ncbi:M48 family metalloprotease, partial [Microbulbifer sp.]|uniref:M48 family metalloprotease n=1 Tax=Microbulbifer sp. TaxID=1908541 RepID=UPI002F942A7D